MGRDPVSQRAAQYLRMSTESQDLSLEFQRATNAAYALEHGLQIVRSYTDAGISGLGFNNRPGLKALLADVMAGTADFSVVLVYDVSRWGRFQNPDQAAHYEFICAEAGVRVAYCAEPFDNDGSPTSTLIKQVKRAMAAEYSRDLAKKVTAARRAIMAQGFWTGGHPAYGYRREVVDRQGRPCETADLSIWRKRQGVHTRLVLGPESEIQTVRTIFRMYLRPKSTFGTIARWLNASGIPNGAGSPWQPARVGHLIQNQIYVGRLVGRYRPREIGSGTRRLMAPEDWLVVDGAAPPIVSPKVFNAAQRKRARKAQPITDAELLDDARRVAAEHGTLSASILNRHSQFGATVYDRRFGGMRGLRNLLGVPAPRQCWQYELYLSQANDARRVHGSLKSDDEILARVGALLAERGYLSSDLLDRTPGVPTAITCRRRFGDMGELYRRVGYQPTPRQLRNGRRHWSLP